MLIKGLIVAGVVLASVNSHAAFIANFAAQSVQIVSQDGKPLPNIRVYYKVTATTSGTCRSAHNPFDWGHPCPQPMDVTPEKDFILTDASGKANIPAVKVSDKTFASKDPLINIRPVGPQVPLKIESGKTYSCAYSLPINSWQVDGLKDENGVTMELVTLTEAQAKQSSGKTFVIKNRDSLANLTDYYLRDAEAIVKREYRDAGSDMLGAEHCI